MCAHVKSETEGGLLSDILCNMLNWQHIHTSWVSAVSRKALRPQTGVMVDTSCSASFQHPTTKESERWDTTNRHPADSAVAASTLPLAERAPPSLTATCMNHFPPALFSFAQRSTAQTPTCTSPRLVPMHRAVPSLLQHRDETVSPVCGLGCKRPTRARLPELQR